MHPIPVACSGCACSHIIRSKESRPSASVWFDPSHSVLYRMSELRRMVGPWAPVRARGAIVLVRTARTPARRFRLAGPADDSRRPTTRELPLGTRVKHVELVVSK